jgi:hypothetical protein
VVLAALAGRLDHRLGHLKKVWPLAVEIVVLEEHRGRQHDIGEGRRLGQELPTQVNRSALETACTSSSSGQTIAGLVF